MTILFGDGFVLGSFSNPRYSNVSLFCGVESRYFIFRLICIDFVSFFSLNQPQMLYARRNTLSVLCAQAVCDWKDYKERMARLREIVQDQLDKNCLTDIDPYFSILFPFTAAQRKAVAAFYARLCADKVCRLSFVLVSGVLDAFPHHVPLCHEVPSTLYVKNISGALFNSSM